MVPPPHARRRPAPLADGGHERLHQPLGLRAAVARGSRRHAVVQEDHGTGLELRNSALEERLSRGAVPVAGIERPGRQLEPSSRGDRGRPLGEAPAGRPPAPRPHTEPTQHGEGIVGIGLGRTAGRVDVGHVMHAVKLHLVPGGEDVPYQVRALGRGGADDEEGRMRRRAIERCQDPRSPQRVGPVVEGEIAPGRGAGPRPRFARSRSRRPPPALLAERGARMRATAASTWAAPDSRSSGCSGAS